jgi:copper chaperone
MTCGGCAATVRRAVETALPGSKVDVDLRALEVTFTGDPEVAADAIRAAGYTPEPVA